MIEDKFHILLIIDRGLSFRLKSVKKHTKLNKDDIENRITNTHLFEFKETFATIERFQMDINTYKCTFNVG